MVYINRDYRLTGRDFNIVIERRQSLVSKDVIQEDSDRWITMGYFSHLNSVGCFLSQYIDDNDMTPMMELISHIEDTFNLIKANDIKRQDTFSVKLNDIWSIDGNSSCFSVIRIKENGKRSIIAFVPTVYLGIKAIFIAQLIQFLNSDDITQLVGIKELIDTLYFEFESKKIIQLNIADKVNIADNDIQDLS